MRLVGLLLPSLEFSPMRGEAIELLKEALHLRMHGENAPGGSENWSDWERKAESFLRELPNEHGREAQRD